MNRTPIPEDDFCWVCRCLGVDCYQECRHRLSPNHPDLIGNDGRPRSKYDLYVQLKHFIHGQEILRQMGHFSLANIPFTITTEPQLRSSLPPMIRPLPHIPQSESSPSGQQAVHCESGQISRTTASASSTPHPLLPQQRDTPLQLSPGSKRKWNESGEIAGPSNLGLRPAKAATILDHFTEVYDLRQGVQELVLTDSSEADHLLQEEITNPFDVQGSLRNPDYGSSQYVTDEILNVGDTVGMKLFTEDEDPEMGSGSFEIVKGEYDHCVADSSSIDEIDLEIASPDWAFFRYMLDEDNHPLDVQSNADDHHAGNQDDAGQGSG